MFSKKALCSCIITILALNTCCRAYMLFGNTMSQDDEYRMNLEIFKYIDRFYSIFRKSEIWNILGEGDVKSNFNFFVDDDNIKELKHYMNLIGNTGPFFDNLTLSFSLLYTKYIAMLYAVNLLNIHKAKVEEFGEINILEVPEVPEVPEDTPEEKSSNEDDEESVEEDLDEDWISDISGEGVSDENKPRIQQIYLKISQYLAWYAYTGNDVLQKRIQEKLSNRIQCATKQYALFEKSFNNLLDKIYKQFFQNFVHHQVTDHKINFHDIWKGIFAESRGDIEIVNGYFTALFSRNPAKEITEENFLKVVQKETVLETFASDLSIFKGRDIDETYPNFDNDFRKEMYEANVINVMMTIENNENKSDTKKSLRWEITSKNVQYITLQKTAEKEDMCIKYQLLSHETLK